MYKRSFRTPLFTLLLVFISTLGIAQVDQVAIRFKTDRATPSEEAIYQKHFSAYTLATLSAEKVSDKLRSDNYIPTVILEFNDQSFSFDLEAHDIRPPHYKLRVGTAEGIIEYPRSPNITYRGHTIAGGFDVRITCDEDAFYALIAQAHDALYIEPAKNLISTAAENQFLIYWASDNLIPFPLSACGTPDIHVYQGHPEEGHDKEDGSRSRACKIVQVATANDHLMFNKHGSVAEVEEHNTAVLNNVQNNYDFEFNDDLELDLVEIFVATNSGNDPFSSSGNIGVILDEFTDWGPTGFNNTHDVASLWSARDFNGNTIGLAWLNAVCKSFRYNVLQDFTSNANLLRVLQAHEMGHNFGASHDPEGSGTIMAPTVNNTNTWSQQSINQINNYINTINCLGPCAPPAPPVANFTGNPTSGCTPLVVTFTDQSTNNPTSWSWTFPGGTPSSSTNQNPIVTYNSPGTYNVSLMVTNANGSNSITKTNYISVGQDPFADFDYQIDDFTVDFENLSFWANSYFWTFGDGTTSTLQNPIHVYDEDGVYTVTLTATNSCGTDVYSVQIEIITLPFADFSATPTSGCAPLEVEFTNYSSINSDFFDWTFPGGSPPFSSQYEPTIIYEYAGSFNVSLTVYNEAGEDTYTAVGYINVLPDPEADFSFTVNGLTVTFNSSLSTGDDFFWNFGDGNVSTQPNPVHTYASGGSYTVFLNVSNACGTDVTSLTVNLNGAPVPDFTANVEYGCAPLVVQFTNNSSGNPTSFSWIFQGGTPGSSNLANPIVTYNTPGVFDVQLTVSNASGENTLVLDDFIEVEFPTASDFVSFTNGAQVTFTNQSSNATSYLWSFGDGEQSGTENPVHIYNEDGTYLVTLIAYGVCGNDTITQQVTIQTPPQADFSAQFSGDCAPVVVNYFNESSPNATSFLWSFPGGSPSSSMAENPVVTYNNAGTYNVTLIVYAPAGSDTLTWSQLVTVDNVPNAAFLLNTNGMTVNFQNQSTNADTYIWLFGDGQNSTEESPSHLYADYGVYEVLLLATNACGTDTMMVIIELSTVPNAFFTFSAHNGCAPYQVQFMDQSQNNPTSWFWLFEGGDPATSNLQNPLVTYSVPGSYPVSLTVTNSEGSDALVLQDLIQVAGQPDATFIHEQNGHMVSLEYPGVDYDSLRWYFGDGRTDNSLNPTVQYSIPGLYEISLIVYNACGSDTASVLVEIITSVADPFELEGSWQIRPNPFSDRLILYGEPTSEGTIQITLLDMQGCVLLTSEWTHRSGIITKEIATHYLPSGVILVDLKNSTGRKVIKAIHQ